MNYKTKRGSGVMLSVWLGCLTVFLLPAIAQLIDKNKAPNLANEGINKSLAQEIGAGRGDTSTVDSSLFIIARDPFRAIRRGRQLFQRKFTKSEGLGPIAGDGSGNVGTTLAIGAGFADSCASCHRRPRGSAGFGGDVVTRPDSRDAPHLFGLGLKEMLADEITAELRQIRSQAMAQASNSNAPVTRALVSKGISYGNIQAFPNGSVDTSRVQGAQCTSCHIPDLRINRDRRLADVETVYDPVTRSRSQFSREELQRRSSKTIPNYTVVGCGNHGAIRPRWPQHQPGGSHSETWRRSSVIAQ
jgi:hypothetical protein